MRPLKIMIAISLLFLATLSACLVSSLHPFFKEEDKYFNESMLGNWIDGDSCIWTIHPNMVPKEFPGPDEPDGSYQITYYEEEDQVSVLTATLFQLNRVDYVDFVPDLNEEHFTSDMTSYHHIPVHTLARVQYNKDSILLYWYGDEWLNELFEQNRIRIKHETVENHDYDRQVLTASTDELQKFMKKYANDKKTNEEIEQIFAQGYTDGQEAYGVFLKLKPYSGPLPEERARELEPVYNN
ncbi:MAG: hypothetical protein P1P86_12380 [Bacteroidales bacterium]|nr:hypothetical protein [Bacteroidales bacterium]